MRAIDEQLDAGLGVAGVIGCSLGAALEGIASPSAARRSLPRIDEPDLDLLCFDPAAITLAPLPTFAAPALDAVSLPRTLLRQRARFIAGAGAILERIAAGEVYQVNLTCGFEVSAPSFLRHAPPLSVAGLQQLVQPVPFGLVMQTPSGRLVSGSMERFLSSRDGVVRSRPIKGTAPRGADAASDAANATALADSAKERAENTMIVDMTRNDLSRVARVGSVVVETLLQPVAYRTVWHLESEVRAELPAELPTSALLAATMPPASVTGCPKIRALETIAELEDRPRRSYCGAVGVALPGGVQDWSVGIRMARVHQNTARIDVGAGIVADSLPEAEWAETCAKARSALALLAASEHLTEPVAAAHGVVPRRGPGRGRLA